MGKIFCPNCNRLVDEYSINCKYCDFDIKDFTEKNDQHHPLTMLNICYHCGSIHSDTLKCDHCGTPLAISDMKDLSEYVAMRESMGMTHDEFAKYTAQKYGGDKFSEEDYAEGRKIFKKWQTEFIQANKGKGITISVPVIDGKLCCPRCKSSNVHKVHAYQKTILGSLFLSKDGKLARKNSNYRCHNCNLEW